MPVHARRRFRVPVGRDGIDIRVFSSGADAERARRPTDVLLLIGATLGLVLVSVWASNEQVEGGSLAGFARALPGLFGWFWEISYDLLLIWPLVLVAMSIAGRGRGRLVRDELLAGALAFGGALLASGVAGMGWPNLDDGFFGSSAPPTYPGVRLAVAVAVITVASPHLGRPFRRVGRWIIALGAAGAIAIGAVLPIGVWAALLVGLGAAAAVHLVFGSPGGRPTHEQVASSLEELGVPADDLRDARLQRQGVALVLAKAGDGTPLLVKVFGRDAWDGQLLTATISHLWYRDSSPHFTLSRVQQVEHEAFVTLLAGRAGVPVLPVVAAGIANGKDALLVIEVAGRRLETLAADEVTDELLRAAWSAVGRMHDAGIAHGGIDADSLWVLPDGRPALTDFGTATAAAAESLRTTDRAQLLVTTALAAGEERAVRASIAAIGKDGLAEILPYLQAAALPRSTIRRMKGRDIEIDGLRDRAAKAAGTELPKLEQLRRVTWGSLAQAALLLVGAYFLVSGIAGLGIGTITDQLQTADSGWFVVALLVGVLSQVAQGFSTIGACPRPLSLGPAFALQLAIQFIALAVPASAARIAMNIRFFQKDGLSGAGAVSVGAIDSLSGFLIQVVMLLIIVFAGLSTLDLSLQDQGGGFTGRLLVLVVVVAILGAIVAIAIPKYRRVIGGQLRALAEPLKELRSATKLLQLFGGNFVAQVLLAASLGLCLRAFGEHISLADLILINTLVSLFAGIMPVPGGIGITEGALMAGLVSAGIPDATALATALTYRLVTFYIPPLWGAFAMRWLKREGYL